MNKQTSNPDYRIVKCYRQPFPHCRFVGKCYKNSDRVDGMFSWQWGQWHENGWFSPLEKQLTEEFTAIYPEAGAYIGLMKNRYGADENYFEYWVGMFLPEGSSVPAGYDYIDFSYDYAGICWIKGKEDCVYCREGECYGEIISSGMTVPSIPDGGCYYFERYVCPRFTTPDENGEIILDIGYFVD